MGIELWRDRRNKQIGITQQCFIKKILKKFNMSDFFPLTDPFQPGLQLRNDSNVNEERTNIPYREAVGSLLYPAMISRPHIVFAVSYVSQFLNNYSSQHWTAVKKILRYSQGTKSFGIIYGRCEEFNGIDLCGYTDADYAGDVTTRRSRTGYVLMINRSPVTWCSQRHQVVALFITEAEYIALFFGGRKAVWIRQLLKELDVPGNIPTVIKVDDQSAMKLRCLKTLVLALIPVEVWDRLGDTWPT
ncbi:hypothetical protein JTB14_012116 [Gonioctena quinquepunctata]|nr:hypothetical protein JTB14_012116 [Gonioctena quinquepunctata]